MAERTETIVVDETDRDGRLDAYLCEHFPDMSRGAIQRLIKDGEVTVNGKKAKSSQFPREKDEIIIHIPPPKKPKIKPVDIPLDVLFEDEHLIVINKPPGLLTHAASGEEEQTLVNALLHHCAGRLSGVGGFERPGIVHRLDKDTSGCIVAAKTDQAHQGLCEQFADRSVEKHYQLITCGAVPAAQGEIEAAIMRHPNHRQVMAVSDSERAKSARTTYKVLRRLKESTWVEAQIHTGRTHQIRVHFKHIGYPLVGDAIYAKRPNKTLIERTNYKAPRQMLHSVTLSLTHPVINEPMTFKAPLPDDFVDALQKLDISGRP